MSVINVGPPQEYTLDDVSACRQFRVPKLPELEGHGRVRVDDSRKKINERGNTVSYTQVRDSDGDTDVPFKACVAAHRSYGPTLESAWVVRNGVNRNGVNNYDNIQDYYGIEYKNFGESLEDYINKTKATNDETDDPQIDDAVSVFLEKLYENHVHVTLNASRIRILKQADGTYAVRAEGWEGAHLFSNKKCETMCWMMKPEINPVYGSKYDFGVRFPKTYKFITETLQYK
jgi:hypothetical protein